MISHFRVFGCQAVAKKWVARINNKSLNKKTERGMRGIFIGFPYQQKGYLLYVPASRQIVSSGDVMFDETFFSTIVTNWRQFHDSLAL